MDQSYCEFLVPHPVQNVVINFQGAAGKHSLALGLAGGLVEGIAEDGVLLLQPGQLGVGALLQLVLQAQDLKTKAT